MDCHRGAPYDRQRTRLLETAGGFRRPWPPHRTAARVLICTLAAFAVPLFLTYGFFSAYPNADLFQFVHPFEGAVEFARFDRLNPFTTDSYIVVLQVTWGLVLRITNVSPADLFRVLPIYALSSIARLHG